MKKDSATRTTDLPAAIKRKALELGYDRRGIITIQDMDGYAAQLAERIEEYPDARPSLDRLGRFAKVKTGHSWVEPIIVLTRHFARYKSCVNIRSL